jgi:hypothetical protein
MATLAGSLAKDVAGLDFAGPIDPANGTGQGWRGYNVGGGLADGGVVLVDSNNRPLLWQTAGADGEADAVNSMRNASRLYTFNGTTWDRLRSVAGGGGTPGTGVMGTSANMWDAVSSVYRPNYSARTVPDGDAGANIQAGSKHQFNGTSWDRERGNYDVSILASAARTAALNSAIQTNYNNGGVIIVITVSAKAAATTLDVHLRANGVSTPMTVGIATAIPAAVGTAYGIMVHPGMVNPAGVYMINGIVPRNWHLTIFPSDANSVTYQVDAFYTN